MGKRKAGILKQHPGEGQKPPKYNKFVASKSKKVAASSNFKSGFAKLRSPLQQQCSVIVGKLLAAASTQRSGCTVKGLCLAPKVQNKRAVYAVVCETLKYSSLLKDIINRAGFLHDHPWVSEAAALVLVYDLLIGQGVKPQGRAERALLAISGTLQQHVEELIAQQAGATSLSDLLPQQLPNSNTQSSHQPRHVRVNTLLTTVDTVTKQLLKPPPSWPSTHQQQLAPANIQQGSLIPDGLTVPGSTITHDHPLVSAGHVVIQGRSSCMPAHALAPQPGWTVLDCCAAPGNKTTHAAALVGPEGRVIACEKDSTRCDALRATVARCRAENVTVVHGDFLKLDSSSKQYSRVQAILLDPSCSGSGTQGTRMDYLFGVGQPAIDDRADGSSNESEFPGPSSCDSKRVASLAAFQTRALKHALSFPNVKRIAYSTCSVYRQENEDVVAAVLPEAEGAGFVLAHALPEWHRRGLAGLYSWSERVVRVHPDLDGGDGFFVAVFERC